MSIRTPDRDAWTTQRDSLGSGATRAATQSREAVARRWSGALMGIPLVPLTAIYN